MIFSMLCKICEVLDSPDSEELNLTADKSGLSARSPTRGTERLAEERKPQRTIVDLSANMARLCLLGTTG